MIDKLDIRIPSTARLRVDPLSAFSWDPSSPHRSMMKRSMHYSACADLRSLGIDALFHARCRYGDHDSKLEIFDVGKKSYSELIALIDRLAPMDIENLGIVRFDLTADVPDVPVAWFKAHARFKFKRSEREYGKIQYGCVGRGEIETLQAGKRPNLIRIYNKTRECQVQFNRMRKQASADADPIDFESEFGMKESDVITRVERQFGGRGIPVELSRIGDLPKLADFNPFTAIDITSSRNAVLPSPEQFTGLDYYVGVGLYTESLRLGMQGLRKQLNKQTRWNAARTLRQYAAFFPNQGDSPNISTADLVRLYRDSTVAQLAA